MKAALVLIALALGLFAYAHNMPAFHEPADGKSWDADVPDRDSAKYHQARAAAVTIKYKLQDWACTLLAFAFVCIVHSVFNGIPAPTSKIGMFATTLAGPAITAVTMAYDLAQGLERREFPPWSDSIGIPLMGIPPIFAVCLVWALTHCALLAGVKKRAKVRLSTEAIMQGNKWLLAVTGITALLLAAVTFEAAYLLVIPGLVWLYFYASIAALRYDA